MCEVLDWEGKRGDVDVIHNNKCHPINSRKSNPVKTSSLKKRKKNYDDDDEAIKSRAASVKSHRQKRTVVSVGADRRVDGVRSAADSHREEQEMI